MVHQLFTSEDADPGVMARVGPKRERFPRATRCQVTGRRLITLNDSGLRWRVLQRQVSRSSCTDIGTKERLPFSDARPVEPVRAD